MIWTAQQRGALAAVVFVITIAMLIRLRLNPSKIDDPQAQSSKRAGEVLAKVDPNSADWPTLAALPSIGPALAKRIVKERAAFATEHPGEMAYLQIDDLLRVKGIGPAVIEAIRPHLLFPEPPASRPSR